jgi:PAS domain-containing protein
MAITSKNGLVAHWTRQLALLRSKAAKRSRVAPCNDLTDDALTTCDALLRSLVGALVESDRLRAEVRTSTAEWEYLFDVMPTACLLTDSAGLILNANRAAGLLLNLNAKYLKDRELVLFSDDRHAFSALRQQLALGSSRDQVRRTMRFRPRDRKSAAMEVVVMPALADCSDPWLWFLIPTEPQQIAPTPTVPAGSQRPASVAG